VLHISALASYKLMGKETQLHLKVLSPEESGIDNYNGRWTFFINDIEYFSQPCSEYWLHHCRLPVNLCLLVPFLSVVGCDRIFWGALFTFHHKSVHDHWQTMQKRDVYFIVTLALQSEQVISLSAKNSKTTSFTSS
jgi:hypothetical protein